MVDLVDDVADKAEIGLSVDDVEQGVCWWGHLLLLRDMHMPPSALIEYYLSQNKGDCSIPEAFKMLSVLADWCQLVDQHDDKARKDLQTSGEKIYGATFESLFSQLADPDNVNLEPKI